MKRHRHTKMWNKAGKRNVCVQLMLVQYISNPTIPHDAWTGHSVTWGLLIHVSHWHVIAVTHTCLERLCASIRLGRRGKWQAGIWRCGHGSSIKKRFTFILCHPSVWEIDKKRAVLTLILAFIHIQSGFKTSTMRNITALTSQLCCYSFCHKRKHVSKFNETSQSFGTLMGIYHQQ